jgi:DNA end-binding protein Ku
MVDEETGEVVSRNDIGRGYDLGKGRYVEIEEDELDAVRLESTHTIEIDSFVPREDVDRRYLERPYYLVPDGKTAEQPFAVIREAMKEKDRAALGRIVMAHREHVMAIEPLGKGLLGTTLRYPYEMRDEDRYFADIKAQKIPKDMIELAAHILDSKEGRFDPSSFHDRYENALKALVKRKASGKKIEPPEPPPERGNVIDLMEALRQSVRGGGKGRRHRAARAGRSRRASARRGRKAA